VDLPLLDKIPFLGAVLNGHSLFVYLTWLFVLVLWVFIYKTPYGFWLRASGEKPETLRTAGRMHTFSAESGVWFRPLSEEEIGYYLDTFAPYDKAGSYGIQEWIGYAAIEKINGSFYNVMGLPIQKVYVELEKFLQ